MDNITLKQVQGFNPNYTEVSKHGISKRSAHILPPPNGDLTELIFAPDPVTGVPRSDLALVVNSNTKPEVVQFIQHQLLSPSKTSSSCGDDADFALASIKGRNESVINYATRLRELASKSE